MFSSNGCCGGKNGVVETRMVLIEMTVGIVVVVVRIKVLVVVAIAR